MSINAGTSASTKPRLASLDGLCAVSIGLVLLQHASLTPSFHANLDHYGIDAGFGVHIFFVISGFIITLLLLREEAETKRISLKQFYCRRIARILPVFWVFLFVMLMVGRIHLGELIQAGTFTSGISPWSTQGTWYTAHGWSLAVEEQFYLLWPAAMLLLPWTVWRMTLLTVALLAGNFTRWWAATHSAKWWLIDHPGHWWSMLERVWHLIGVRTFLSHVDLLAWGCLLAIAMMRVPHWLRKVVGWRPTVSRFLAVVVLYLAPWYLKSVAARYGLPTDAWVNTVRGAAVAYLIASLTFVQRGWSYHVLNSRPVVAVGLMSYSLYVWQQPFLGEHITWPWMVNVVITFAVAAVSYHVVEKPLRKLVKHRVALQPQPAANAFVSTASPATLSA